MFASHHKGPGFKTPGILLLALSRYIGDPDVIDHFCGFVWGGLHPEPSLGPRAGNVLIPLDLTQLFCPGFMLAAGPPSGFTTMESAAGGEPCGEPAISPHSHHVSLVQWTTCLLPVTRDPGSKPLGGVMWNRDSPVSVVSLQYCTSPIVAHPGNETVNRWLKRRLIWTCGACILVRRVTIESQIYTDLLPLCEHSALYI
jgi:hypothetical protein